MVWREELIIAGYVIGGIVGGIFFGLLVAYVILRLQRRPFSIPYVSRMHSGSSVPDTGGRVAAGPEQRTGQAGPTPDILAEFMEKRGSAAVVQETVQKKSEGLVEVEADLEIAATASAAQLLPFRTAAWDNKSSDFDSIPARVREELAEAYADMRLANYVVWLATEVGRRKELEVGYAKLCDKIAERLNGILPLLRS